MIHYDSAPNGLGPSIQRYIEHRIPFGSFMTAVVCNDLREACACADDDNKYLLFQIVQWFYNEAPHNCWGSKECVIAWLNPKEESSSTPEDDI